MGLRRLQVTDFRCLQSAELDLDRDFTLISGLNASGKTSLLEAIYVLGRGRSFRTRRLDTVIKSGSSKFVVFGEVELAERRVGMGVEGSSTGVKAKLAGEAVSSLVDLAAVLPVQVIDPEVHRLIEEGPSQRRRFLDWGVFHVEHAFVPAWRGYQRVLKQRNAALRAQAGRPAISAWNGELARLGEIVNLARARYINQLIAPAAGIAHRLLGFDLTLNYRPGWGQESLASALTSCWARDLELGSTSVGPQRADLVIKLDGTSVKDRISRGQQKLLAASLLLAQVSLFSPDAAMRPTLLLDDPAAELDSDRLFRLIEEVVGRSVQLIVTSLDPHFKAFGSPGRRYVIERGIVREG